MSTHVRERPGRSARPRNAFPFRRIYAPASGSFGTETPPVISFGAALTTTLVADNSMGLGTPTFTRATTAYQTDFEGKLNLVPSGATREQGARYVVNTVLSSEDLATGWGASGSGIATAGFSDPDGGTNAFRIVTSTAAINSGVNRGAGTWTGNQTQSVVLRGELGGEQVSFGDAGNRTTVTLTTSWQRFAGVGVTKTNTFVIYSNSLAQTWYAYHPQAENVTGQTNQNPSEYVSVGVLSAPWHGANLDGVKYFDTLNGNTVASNVVTEATGARIDSSQAACAGGVTAGVVNAGGPVGLLTENSAINLALQSQTLDNASWVQTAADMDVTANVAVAPDGTTTADKIREKATTAGHYLYQINLTGAAANTFSFYAKAAERSIVYGIVQSSAGAIAYFNLATGAVGTVSGTLSPTAAIEPLPDGWFRCSITTASATAGQPVYLGVTTTDNVVSYLGEATKGVYFWQGQHERASFASSPITTTTVAVTRNASVAQYVSAGNLSATAMTIAMEITPSTALGSTAVYSFGTFLTTYNNSIVLYHDATKVYLNKVVAAAGNTISVDYTRSVGVPFKVVVRLDTVNGMDIWVNGTKGTGDSSAGAKAGNVFGTNFQIGGDGNGANQDYCAHRNFRVYPSSLPDSTCAALST